MSVKNQEKINAYNTKNYTQIAIRFHKEKQKDIIDQIRNQPNSAGYIAQLVRDDMAKHNHDNNVN